MVGALAFIGSWLFRSKVCRKAISKQEIAKNAGATLPKFWEDENRDVELLEIT